MEQEIQKGDVAAQPNILDVAQWTTDKYQKRQREIFGWGQKPQQKFLILCNSGST